MKALIIVDVQNDFVNGNLAVKDAETIIPELNRLIDLADSRDDMIIIGTKDSHPNKHSSFASTHGVEPFTEVKGIGVVWPDHCVEGSEGWRLHPDLKSQRISAIVLKGRDKDVDSYSGFKDANGKLTELDSILKDNEVNEIFICGLATDYCVKATAIDGAQLGYKTHLVKKAHKPVFPDKLDETLIDIALGGVIV